MFASARNPGVLGMMVGMPVVSTDVGGIPSLIEHYEEGMLVAAGDPAAMADAILRLVRDEALADGLAEAARLRAQRRHDPATVARTQVEIYREILAAGRAAGRR